MKKQLILALLGIFIGVVQAAENGYLPTILDGKTAIIKPAKTDESGQLHLLKPKNLIPHDKDECNQAGQSEGSLCEELAAFLNLSVFRNKYFVSNFVSYEKKDQLLQAFKIQYPVNETTAGSLICNKRFSSICSPYKPKPSIIEPLIKNLSLGLFSSKSYEEQYPTIVTTMRDGVLLYGYNYALQYSIAHVIQKVLNVTQTNIEIKPQFEERPSFFYPVIGAPILEEVGHTFIPRIFLGRAAKYIMPIWFGLSHYNKDPITWAIQAIFTSITNFLNHRYLDNNPNHIMTPTIHHMINNIVALHHLNKEKQ